MKKKRSPGNRMRMKQLTEATGVTKATVQHYIKEGLVPKPVKTHRNMAYYNASHVNAIRLIKELQSKRFLPLSVIKQVMKGGRRGLSVDEIQTLVQIDGKLFRNLQENPTMEALSLRELSARTSVRPQDIRDMERLGMIRSVTTGKKKLFAEDDIRIVECVARLQKVGFTPELDLDASVLKVHHDLLRILVEEEARLLTSRVTGKVPVQRIPAMVEEATAILNTIMGLFHKKLIVETARRYTLEFRGEGNGSRTERSRSGRGSRRMHG
ncbi:MAG: MerR family transcriptional regulator [bacterium]|nr:MAG: MerR family transcriptional regulator [bacterium]